MTAVGPGSHVLSSVEMSYDEIDFANRLGNEDIEIDIDLEAGQNDEDYILEDINSVLGHGEAMISLDDVMNDDENVSYPMDDVDTFQEDQIEMEDAEISDALAVELHDSEIVTLPEGSGTAQLADFDRTSEPVAVQRDSLQESSNQIEGGKLMGEHELIEEAGIPDQRTVDVDTTLSPSTSQPNDSVAQTSIGLSALPSDSTYNKSLDANPGDISRDESGEKADAAAITEHTQGQPEVNPETGRNIIQAVAKVNVIYRDVEYALCSNSELDDPDTYFLKDNHLVNESLANLLNGLRQVIHEDIRPEDVLCLTMEDLGIEISETSVSAHEVTFGSLINLYEKLLRNDGVETPGPFYVTLGTRPDFAKRLKNLAAAAAEGKGMSDLAPWDDESDEVEGESEVRTEQQLKVSDESAGTSNDPTQNNPGDIKNDDVPKEKQSESEESIENPEHEGDDVAVPENHDEEQLIEGHDQDQPATLESTSRVASISQDMTHDNSSDPHITEISEYSKDGLDEDGDLIDYEDEEYEKSRETSASANVDSNDKQNDKAPVPNQNLLTSAPVEDPQYLNEEDDNYSRYHENEEDEGDNLLAHEHTNEEDVDETEDFHVPDGSTQDEKEDDNVVHHNIAVNVQQVFDTTELEYQSSTTQPGHDDTGHEEYNPANQESFNFEEAGQPVTSGVNIEEYSSLANDIYDDDRDEISYEEADIPHSNDSEHTLIEDESTPYINLDVTQDNDEINYDTDDERESAHLAEQEVASEASPTVNGHIGKRQRNDAEDVTDKGPNPYSKRARS